MGCFGWEIVFISNKRLKIGIRHFCFIKSFNFECSDSMNRAYKKRNDNLSRRCVF